MLGKRFVAFADILGFKALVSQTPLTELAERIDLLIGGLSNISVPWLMATIEGESSSGAFRPHHLHFSDTVVLWTDPLPDFNSLERFTTGFMFASAVSAFVGRSFVSGLPLRVGVAFGEMFVDENRRIIVGQPLVDAYAVEESQDWVGGAFHASVPDGTTNDKCCAVAYNVPLKTPMHLATSSALDWVYPAAINFRRNEQTPSSRQYFEKALEEYLAKAPSASVRRKYENVREFYRQRVKDVA